MSDTKNEAPPNWARHKAYDLLRTLEAINRNEGYKWTQPLMRASDDIAHALAQVRQRALESCEQETNICGPHMDGFARCQNCYAAELIRRRIRALKQEPPK